jgi:hypothetical protein
MTLRFTDSYGGLLRAALTATKDGKRTFARLGLVPTGYEEVWVRRQAGAAGQVAGQARLVCVTPETKNADEALAATIGSAEVLGRAQMMFLRRG